MAIGISPALRPVAPVQRHDQGEGEMGNPSRRQPGLPPSGRKAGLGHSSKMCGLEKLLGQVKHVIHINTVTTHQTAKHIAGRAIK